MANFKLIRDISKEKGISIRLIANEIGIKEESLHHIIKNGSTNTTTLENIARVLGVPVGIFFNDFPSPSEESIRIRELEKDNAHLRELLEEKERTIKILVDLQNQ